MLLYSVSGGARLLRATELRLLRSPQFVSGFFGTGVVLTVAGEQKSW